MTNIELVVLENGLVPIYQDQEGRRVVNARELYAFLESKQEFANWIKNRIEKYEFEKDVDFTTFDNFIKNPKGGRPIIEYLITVDVAKEIAMVENNEKGREVRKYFIECEKRLNDRKYEDINSDVFKDIRFKSMSDAYRRYADLLDVAAGLVAENNILKVKAEAAGLFLNSLSGHTAEEAAKLLDFKNVGRNTFLRLLREFGVLTLKNFPTAEYMNWGWFRIIDIPLDSGSYRSVPYFLPKGLEGIMKMFLERGYEFSDSKYKDMGMALVKSEPIKPIYR